MAKKKKPQLKRRTSRAIGSKRRKRKKSEKPKLTLKQRMARAKKLEGLEGGKPVFRVSREGRRRKSRSAPQVVISDSVGRWEENARNLPDDVKTVQRLLQTAAQKLLAPQLDPKGIDGKIAQPPGKSNTVS